MDRRSGVEKNERIRRDWLRAAAWLAVGDRRLAAGDVEKANWAFDRSERIIVGLERERAARWAMN
jgi:hypothetical protein